MTARPRILASLAEAQQQLGRIVLGKPRQVRLSLACMLAGGHLLLEDVPGVGKTTLAHALARTLGLQYQRVQFTSDLLPADLIGVSVFMRDAGEFRFHRGPVFAQLVLADEINRAPPKTQSALLEAMAEYQVTHDGATHALPTPFFVIATQNPLEQIGTHALPESQLDRFTMRISLGYPDPSFERVLYLGGASATEVTPIMNAEQVVALQAAAAKVYAAPALVDYVLALVQATRAESSFAAGLSPRGGLALLACARAWALLDQREMVVPEDVQAVFAAVAGHRLLPSGASRGASQTAVIDRLLASVAIP
ncbi:AAA family ATPase [Cupriavidus plantarum]|uniref:MoxR-like ATPase n=1 Tax=Cupriavidus plantarum TaxID=942865 RepID=A0A316ELA1_9BURK|nr:MoxR family ATPase [Cupriavidus plantarum]PWK31343.1 MoxR-like ATPase [Cupriavidus plantarum]RLK39615.1 MoxR-like ATPase [Cupriavidus plantarum]